MPFDPNLPENNSPISAAELRAQFTSLKTSIDGLTATVAAQAAQIAALPNVTAVTALIASNAAKNVDSLVEDGTAFDDPPTQGQLEDFQAAFNQLITGLHS
ncbi:MAG: hypothetical protein ABI042_08415 [Verrucomicrobiota bacterium]